MVKRKNNNKPTILVTKLVKKTCCVMIQKGRINSTASKLLYTNPKCIRIAKQMNILGKRFNLK